MLEALVERNGFDTADVDDVVWGTSSQVGEQSGDLGRMAALDAGYDVRASGVTLDRFCGSGITANNFAASDGHGRPGGPRHRRRHRDDVAAEEGPHADGRRQRAPAGDPPAVAPGRVRRRHRHRSRASTARRSTRTRPSRSAAPRVAIEEGRFDRSLDPGATTSTARVALDHEEFPRPQTTAESLAALAPSFPAVADYRSTRTCPTFRELINQKYPDLEIEHVHHAGNSSGVVDGAAAVLYGQRGLRARPTA